MSTPNVAPPATASQDAPRSIFLAVATCGKGAALDREAIFRTLLGLDPHRPQPRRHPTPRRPVAAKSRANIIVLAERRTAREEG